MTGLTTYSPKHRLVKRNVLCAYCGTRFTDGVAYEDEHVIGRKFVPKGSLAGNWNLIVRVCGACNDHKAMLENDLSSITMQPDGLGRFAVDDPRLAYEARRKGRATSARTGNFVSEPEPPFQVQGTFGAAKASFSFTAPAQLDDERAFELARYQLAGFFFMLTYDAVCQQGYYWPGRYFPVVVARRDDWGHAHLLSVEQTARSWEYRLHAVTADGFYKLWIKRRPGDPAVWAWAMEWNRNFRLAGFFGEETVLVELRSELLPLDMETVSNRPSELVRMRTEQPLTDVDDHLFYLPP